MRRWWAAAVGLCIVGCGSASGSRVRQVGGLLEMSPGMVEFGDVALGREATIAVSLQNDGIVPMTVTQLTELQGAEFEVKGLPAALGPGEKTKLSVRYRPPALGAHARSLQLATDSPAVGNVDLALHGHAVRGLATLSGDAFDFGPVVLNEVRSQTFLLSNNDGHALTSVRIEAPTGGDATSFTVKPPGDSPLQAEQTMVVTVDFRPGRLGDFSAVVPVTPCPTCSPRNVTLSGRGVTRLLDVRPATIDFGEVLLGSAPAQGITVTNTSTAPLVLQSLQVPAGEFTVSLDGATWPMTLAPGQTLTGVVTYKPRTLGDKAAQVTMLASDGAPGSLALTGTGFGAVLQATPRNVFLGPAALGTTRPGALQITNVGLDPHQTAPLTVSNISVLSQDAAWSLQTGTPIAVGEPGSSVTVHFSFRPTHVGLSQATLVIASNDGLHPQLEVPLAAMGRELLPCKLAAAPNPVDFGPTRLFSPAVQGVELTNQTADDCIIGDPSLSGDAAFRWPGGVTPAGRTLPPGGRMSVRIEFAPEQARNYSGAVTFYVSNAAAQSMTVPLAGVGDSGCFFLSPATADFGAATQGCNVAAQTVYAVNHCAQAVHYTGSYTEAPFSVADPGPRDIAPNTALALQVGYTPASIGDDVGTLSVSTTLSAVPWKAGLTGGSRTAATVVDQWDQSTPKVDMLIVIDNSGSMAEEQHALAMNLDHLWNRIALANADFHIAVTTTGMDPYTAGWSQCPGGASGGEGGRFFPVDNTHPRLLTPQTPNVKDALFQDTNVGLCHWKEQFTEPVVAALTDPLIGSTKAPGTPWPADGNAGFLRDDARLALMAVSDSDDDIDLANPPPVSYLIDKLRTVKHGALDLVSFAGIVATEPCSTVEAVGSRYMEIARQLHGNIFDICQLNNFGPMLDSALGALLQPLSSFPLSTHPKDPGAIAVTVDGAAVTNWTYDAGSNRIVFPAGAVPAPGSHITAQYEPACN